MVHLWATAHLAASRLAAPATALSRARWALHWAAVHSGVPALLLAALALAIGFKLGGKLLNFSLQVLAIAAVLAVLTAAGILRL